MLTLSVCFTAAASTSNTFSPFTEVQHVDNLKQLSASVPIAVGAILNHNSALPLDQPTRLEIYNNIKENPGVHFRGICDGLGLSVGVVQYHLNVLEHAGLITNYSEGQNKRYFQADTFSQADMKMISLLRHQTAAQILTILSENHSALHRDIAHSLGVSSQALTWQMNQLKNSGLISAQKESINVKYILTNPEAVKLAFSLMGDSKN